MATETQLEFSVSSGPRTQNGRLRELFLARPGEWLSMVELGQAIGAWAVHSRVADLRRQGLAIENRIEVAADGKRLSYYRLVSGGVNVD
jgi:hypothetical protein